MAAYEMSKKINSAYNRAKEDFDKSGERYVRLLPHELKTGFSFDSIKNLNKRMFENLVLILCGLEEEDLYDIFYEGHMNGHKAHVHLPGMGHVHKSELLKLIYKANKYLDSL